MLVGEKKYTGFLIECFLYVHDSAVSVVYNGMYYLV